LVLLVPNEQQPSIDREGNYVRSSPEVYLARWLVGTGIDRRNEVLVADCHVHCRAIVSNRKLTSFALNEISPDASPENNISKGGVLGFSVARAAAGGSAIAKKTITEPI
jgi:hypothetical protein